MAGVGLQRITDTAEETTLLVSDHLGSVVRVVSLDGHIVERMDYDEHGARRTMSDPRYPGLAAVSTPRGFTGHEHLDVSNIVHMNGRIYDHRIGRFLQVDPFVQAPYNSQSHNRYTYVFNNPLVWTDPSGYLGQKERQWLGALITIAATSTGNFWVAVGGGFVGGAVATQSLEGGLMGAFAAGVTAGIGLGGVDGGTMSGFMVRAVAGGGISVLQGGKFGHGFAAAGTGMLVGNATAGMRPGSQFVLITLAGGAASRATGGKFANGAVTAMLSYAVGAVASRAAEGRVDDYFDHFSFPEDAEDPQSSPMPRATRRALGWVLRSPYGRQLSEYLDANGGRISLVEVPAHEAFTVIGDNEVWYIPDVRAFRAALASAGRLVPGDGMDSATLDTLLVHEIGHTLLGSAAIGQLPIPVTSLRTQFQEEERVINHFENPYRAYRGLPMRCSYFTEGDMCQ